MLALRVWHTSALWLLGPTATSYVTLKSVAWQTLVLGEAIRREHLWTRGFMARV